MSHILTKQEGSALRVTLNRPDLHNAFNPEMIKEVTELFRKVSGDKNIRAVVLSGNGKSFCSGADLEWMKSMVNFSFEENRKDSLALFDMFDAIAECPVPVLGKVHGNVMGGGLGLVAVCDIVAAEKDTRFCFSEVKLGLVPAVISPFVLRKANESFAREVMITGEVFDVKIARAAGLVHFAAEDEEASDFIESRLDFILANAPEAVRSLKQLLNDIRGRDWREVREKTTQTISERRVSPEGQDGLRAFLEKRVPAWKKK